MKIYADRITMIRPPGWCSSPGSQKGIRMLNQQTIEKLHAMKLHGMADAFHTQLETTDAGQLSFEERFALLVCQAPGARISNSDRTRSGAGWKCF